MSFLETLESRRLMSVTPVADAAPAQAQPAAMTVEALTTMQLGVDHAGRICLMAKGQKTLYLNLDGTIGKWNPNAEPYDEFTRAAYQDCATALADGAPVSFDGSLNVDGQIFKLEVTSTRWYWHSQH
jgi:hypothetical protein